MRKFTKCLMALGLLLIAGVANAKETVICSVDYSTMADKEGVPFSFGEVPAGASVNVKDGLLVIENTSSEGDNWALQLAVASDFPTVKGFDYRYTITYKVVTDQDNPNVSLALVAGVWPDEAAVYGVALTKSDKFETLTQEVKNFGFTVENTGNIKWQSRGLVGTIYIKKVEVIEIIPDEPVSAVTYGDLAPVTPVMYTKNFGEAAALSTPEAGLYKITSGATASEAWDTQFWISVGNTVPGLPAGQKFKISFEYKADKAATASTQTHSADPTAGNAYIMWHCIGDVDFTDEWKTFEKTVTIESDMAGWQSVAFNLNEKKDVANVFYFRNISLEVPEILGEAVDFTVGSVGYATYSSAKNVSLGSVKGYAASYNGSYIELSPVTEVPAGSAVIIEGAGKHSFEVIASAAAISNNDLLVSDGNVEGDGTIYVLAKKDKVGFYKLGSGVKVPKGKGYLKVAASAPDFIGFGGTTGIETAKTVKANGEYYNLAGQRVAQPTKGLYIVNGKKVVIK